MMKLIRFLALAFLALSVTACGSIETATRNLPLDVPPLASDEQVLTRNYSVQGMTFAASDELQVSERNSYYPFVDIVWRGDPIGDRRQQIGAIFQTAADRVALTNDGAIPVVLDIELVRFHGVTERTRFSVGGNYHIVFMMAVRHAETGVLIEPGRKIVGNLSAPGGSAAILADQRGQTEKVRVTDYITQMLKDETAGEYIGLGPFQHS